MEEELLDIPTPGEILKTEFMEPLGISINGLGRDLSVPVMRISKIVNGKGGITIDTARRLAVYFANDYRFWMNLQVNYDFRKARRNDGGKLEDEIQPRKAS